MEKNKAIVRRWFEALNKKDLAILDEIAVPEYFDRTRQLRGLENIKQLISMVLRAFPDYHETVEEIIAEADKVWTRETVTGTNTGEYLGLAPTGKQFTTTAINIWRLVDSKVVEKVGVLDQLDIYKQLGIIGYTEKGKKLF
jgi:predicted ester cyclase